MAECYLALTGAEMDSCTVLPGKLAWMACHFSAYATGLSNFPETLPAGSILMVNDRTPICGHDPRRICEELAQMAEAFSLHGILLDLQRPDNPEAAELVKYLAQALPCPVAVTEYYAEEAGCPVFLSPPPLNVALAAYLKPWKNRQVWLEAALSGQSFTVTEQGCTVQPLHHEAQSNYPFHDSSLHCHYNLQLQETSAVFNLLRTPGDLQTLLEESQSLGVTTAIGLYQELNPHRER